MEHRTTTRLILREMTADDAPHAFRLNNDPDVLRFTGDVPFASEEAARAFLAGYPDYARNGYGRWAVLRKADNAWLGWCGLKLLSDGRVDLGYRLLREHWGNGYAIEAGRHCITFGFEELGLKRIIGMVAPENVASIRVLEKVGMHYWKTEEQDHEPDALIYRIDRA